MLVNGLTAEKIYRRLPITLQNVACSYYGASESRLRLGKLFQQRLAELMKSEGWSAEWITAYQNEKLCEAIRHAYENVPYYRDLMKSLKLAPRDIRSTEDLHKLPILTKADVR